MTMMMTMIISISYRINNINIDNDVVVRRQTNKQENNRNFFFGYRIKLIPASKQANKQTNKQANLQFAHRFFLDPNSNRNGSRFDRLL